MTFRVFRQRVVALKLLSNSTSQTICSYLKCGQVHSNKQMSGAGSPSRRPGSVQLNV